jgi:hypothetical protein
MDRQSDTTLENQENLVARRSCIERGADLAARAFFIQIRARTVQGE